MKRKLAGDKRGAREFFQKCVDTKYANEVAYFNAGVEMQTLQKR